MKKVRCIKSTDRAFKDNCIYDVIDGRIIDEDGVPRPCMVKVGEHPISTLADIRNFKDGNWSWIGEFSEVISG